MDTFWQGSVEAYPKEITEIEIVSTTAVFLNILWVLILFMLSSIYELIDSIRHLSFTPNYVYLWTQVAQLLEIPHL